MSETLNSQLSAFIDGELPEREAQLFLKQLAKNPALLDEAARFLKIGRAIRGEAAINGLDALYQRIAAAIDAEAPAPAERVRGPSMRLLRPAGGVAIAAAVAVVAIVGLQQVQVGGDGATVQAATELAAIAIDEAPLYTEPPVDDFVSDRPSEMLSLYYRHHGERSADLGASNILTRLVTLELREGELVEITPPAGDAAGASAADEAPDRGSAPNP